MLSSEFLSKIDFPILLIFSGIFLLLFAIAEIAYHIFKIDVEYTRKFVHIFTGLISLAFPIYLKNPLDLLILCVSFALIVGLSIKLNLLHSVNAIKRTSRGSILFPIVVIVSYLFQYYHNTYVYFFIPILTLALADPAAAFIGKKYPKGKFSILGNQKTFSGCMGFFVTALVIGIYSMYLFENAFTAIGLIISLTIALAATIGEAVSIRGYDNLVVPLCCIAVLLMFGI